MKTNVWDYLRYIVEATLGTNTSVVESRGLY